MQKENNKELVQHLLDKSLESFILGLEIFNKPTIKYRIEGFSFFICNAWELMLKAELIKKDKSIYYKDSDRTISLSEAVKRVYSDEHTRTRLNLEQIIDLRNTSTHFITQEYELKYIPLFQANVFNFERELKKRHNLDISEYLPENFLALSGHIKPLTDDEIRIKYPSDIAERLIRKGAELQELSDQYNSNDFSIAVKQNLYITKKKSEADFSVSIENNTGNTVQIIKELKDPANTHPLNFNTVAKLVQDQMLKKGLKIDNSNGFTTAVLTVFINFYNIKDDEKYSYAHRIGKTCQWSYSRALVDFIINEITKNQRSFYASLRKEKR